MRLETILALWSVPFLVTSPARADDTARCVSAAADGQDLRDRHKLLEARDRFRACVTAACPAVVQRDCAGWLTEVERQLPSVVIYAKSAEGADLFDLRVTLDGQPFASKLDGQSVAMDPGPHTFHFETADGSAIDRRVLVREGEKSQPIAVVLGAAPAVRVIPPAEAVVEPGRGTSGWKTFGWVAGGLGVAGLAMGTVFGVLAINDKSSAHCGTDNLCDPGTSVGIKRAALLSDVGWIAGGTLLAGGVALLLLAPAEGGGVAPAEGGGARTSVRVAPVLIASGGVAVIGGDW
jgi:hypothetical protein